MTSELTTAARRGIDWILAQQRDDGSFAAVADGIGAYYKVPYALSLHGELHAAHKLADWIFAYHFTDPGDFRGPQRKAREPVHEAWPVYGNAWLVQGLHRLGRWDLSLPGAQFLLKYQKPSGGFYALDEEGPFLEPVCTSWGGLAALHTGHIDAARRAGDLLAKMAIEQPDSERFYFRMDVEGRLITAAEEGQELQCFVDAGRREQIYYNPGIALIFLAHLYRATGAANHLEACRALFSFAERCADDVYAFPPSGKLGLGCALLHALTGDPAAYRAALQVGHYLVATQTPEGFWRLPDAGPYTQLAARDSFDIHLDIAAEFSIFLSEIAARVPSGAQKLQRARI
ncbi:MAG: hypothetical protein VX293_02310 [Candidatus Latescibacterota bacterium]|nr:hypothetical protein [Candidatus Latescibacterota bacterium]